MKPRRSRKQNSPGSGRKDGKLRDVCDGLQPGEAKEIDKNMWAINPIWIALDPPEPIKKSAKSKSRKK